MSQSIQHNAESNLGKTGDALNRQITVDGRVMIIQEMRKATLKKGCNIIQAEGVPNNVDRSSIMCRVRAEKPVMVKSKTPREAEKMTAQRALTELKGTEVLVHYTTPFKLQTYNGNVVCGDSDELVLARPNGETMIAKQPEAISAKRKLQDLREVPALEFEIESGEDQEVDLAILFHAFNRLDSPVSHNLILDEKAGVILSLESNVDLSNNSGCDWSNVTIKIMTGKQQESTLGGSGSRGVKMASFDSYSMESAGGAAAAESVGERKLFELPPGISIKNGDSKLIQLNLATSIPSPVEFYLEEGTYENQPAQSRTSFKNLACDKSSGLGKPIAAGKVRVYQADSSGNLQLTNQLQIEDTPVGQTARLELRGTPDIKATRRLVKQDEKFGDKNGKALSEQALQDLEKAQAAANNRRWVKQPVIIRQTFEVTINNFKDRQVEVSVPQSLGGNQKILKPSSKFTVDSANRAKAIVKLAARSEQGAGEATLTYIVETFQQKDVQVGD